MVNIAYLPLSRDEVARRGGDKVKISDLSSC